MKLAGPFAATLMLAAAAATIQSPFLAWKRLSETPILQPRGDGFESAGTFNPAVIRNGSEFAMLYRAQDRQGISRLGYAASRDGIHFMREAEPVFSPETAYEQGGGVEDPRLVKIAGTFFLTYTAYNRVDAQLCLAKSNDLHHWQRLGIIMPANRGRWNIHWTKSGAILDEKLAGHYWMYFLGDAAGENGGSQMGVASSDDLVHWSEPLDRPILAHRAGLFDSKVVEPGPPPILTDKGVLLIYNGADDKLVYRTGWALFDRTNPANVIARSDSPVFEPEKPWEKAGQVPNVVFVEGLVRTPGRWLLYYGGGDMNVGIAATSLAWR